MSQTAEKISLGVLVSGVGTNLQAIIAASAAGQIAARVAVVIADRAEAAALTRAQEQKIPAVLQRRADFPDRSAFEAAIVATLQAHRVELVCLAGYMRIVGTKLLAAFPERIVNIHPALLPAFPGLHAPTQALAFGAKVTGCTVHFVDGQVDHGPIICQAAVAIHEDESVETLTARIRAEEHRIYPEAIQLFAMKRLHLEGRRVRILASTHKGGRS